MGTMPDARAGGGPGLAQEALPRPRLDGPLGRQQLDGDSAVQAQLAGEVHDPHAAVSQVTVTADILPSRNAPSRGAMAGTTPGHGAWGSCTSPASCAWTAESPSSCCRPSGHPSEGAGALPARGPDRRPALASGHRAHLRGTRGLRLRVLRDGVTWTETRWGGGCVSAANASRHRGPAARRGGRALASRARPRRGAPRREARQHPDGPGDRPRAGLRLRDRACRLGRHDRAQCVSGRPSS